MCIAYIRIFDGQPLPIYCYFQASSKYLFLVMPGIFHYKKICIILPSENR